VCSVGRQNGADGILVGADDIANHDRVVRATPGRDGERLVSKQYVDAAVANRAVDAAVVHLAGAEVVNGTKQFAAPPWYGAGRGERCGQQSVRGSGGGERRLGSYVAKAGDTMTGR